MRSVHESRAAQRKVEAEEAEQVQQLERVKTITALSISLIGCAHSNWLEAPHSHLDGMSPREAAALSAGHLEIVTRLLRSFEAELVKKAKWVDELEREASKLFPRPDKLRLYMTAGDPELPGLVSPTVYTKDEQTMQQCLALLRRRYGRR